MTVQFLARRTGFENPIRCTSVSQRALAGVFDVNTQTRHLCKHDLVELLGTGIG
jgi:hypothetical protein